MDSCETFVFPFCCLKSYVFRYSVTGVNKSLYRLDESPFHLTVPFSVCLYFHVCILCVMCYMCVMCVMCYVCVSCFACFPFLGHFGVILGSFPFWAILFFFGVLAFSGLGTWGLGLGA